MSGLGEWEIHRTAVMGIHAALLNSGQVLLFSYPSKFEDEHDPQHRHSVLGSASYRGEYELLNPSDWSTTTATESQTQKLERNIFCGGTCFLGNGDLFSSGGQYQAIHNPLLLFDPPSTYNYTFSISTRWKKRTRMFLTTARWYPTCLTLPNGDALIISGASGLYGIKQLGPFSFVNRNLQFYNHISGTLSTLQKIPFKIGLYPFMHLLPSGAVFIHSGTTTRLYNPANNNWIKKKPGSSLLLEKETNYRYSRINPVQGSSVLLPLLLESSPKYRARVMLIGGGGESEDPHGDTPATDTCEIIDFGESDPEWKNTSKMNFRRVMLDAVLLPDGNILVVNGCEKGKSDDGKDPVMVPELFDTRYNSWTKLAPMQVPRLYHATAILLPDARVMTAGTDREWNKSEGIRDEYRVEIFTPPYLTQSPRPTIKNVGKHEVLYGEEVQVDCDSGEEVAMSTLVRPSSVTHSLNTDQRCLGLEITKTNKNSISVKMPQEPILAPQGYYMLFIVNTAGRPSRSVMIRIRSA
jgi:Domain of unknown function (DUF1929)/Glyoxal oxidase N-terminus